MTVTAHRYQAGWNGITFNEHYTANDGNVDGSGTGVNLDLLDKTTLEALQDVQLQVADYREMRQYLEGTDPNEAYEMIRLLRMQGRIFGSTWGKLEDRKLALDGAFSVAATRLAFMNNNPKGLAALTFRIAQEAAPGYADRLYYCRPAGAHPIVIARQGMGLVLPYTAELIAFDTKMYDAALSSQALLTNGNPTTCTNGGNAVTMPKLVIVLSGSGSNPVTLTNTTTGQAMTFNFAGLGAGTYTLDCTGKTSFTKADGTNVYSTRLSGWMSQMFFTAGANAITWSGATGVSSVTAQWRSAWS